MKPYYEKDGITIYHGDCREISPSLTNKYDVAVVDPPYGDTSLEWDVADTSWLRLLSCQTAWVFGSMRYLLRLGIPEGWKLAQDVVWEKHNGSSFHADRFKRVHEHAVQFYRGEWSSLIREPPVTNDATARAVRRKERPPHTGEIANATYVSVDGGPRLARSVLRVRSCHGHAEHPTQKPVGIVLPLVSFSCPAWGVVFDPFMGSGTTLVAARRLGRMAIGIEIEERYCEVAAKRLGQSVMFGADE